jgi:hypothetical protein
MHSPATQRASVSEQSWKASFICLRQVRMQARREVAVLQLRLHVSSIFFPSFAHSL